MWNYELLLYKSDDKNKYGFSTPNGELPTREEWIQMKTAVDSWYNKFSDADLIEYNKLARYRHIINWCINNRGQEKAKQYLIQDLLECAHCTVEEIQEMITKLGDEYPELTMSKWPNIKPERARVCIAGIVYVLRSELGYFKIGKSKDYKNRKKWFDIKLPFKVDTELVIKTGDIDSLENELHNKFQEQRVNGEWFNLSENDLSYLKSLEVVNG